MVHVGLPVQVHEGAVVEASGGSRVSEAFVQVVTTVADIFIPLLYILQSTLFVHNLDKFDHHKLDKFGQITTF